MEPDTTMPGQCGCDRDTFLRVWRRVQPEDTPDSPISLEDAPPEPEQAPAGPGPLQPPAQAADGAGDDFPSPHDVPCLGVSSASHAPVLQEFIGCALRAGRAYQVLARRAAGGAGRLLSTLAAEQRQAAKRLSTALFLITGLRYWPSNPAAPAPTSYRGALRDHFLAEQQQEGTYRTAAADCPDPCLYALYIDLAEACAGRAARLRALLESL